MVHQYKLTYFDMKGRAEAIRLAFHIANIPFEDERIKHEDWEAKKDQTPFGQVPVLTIDKKIQIAQTDAILRLIGRSSTATKLYPDDLIEAAVVDQFVNAVEDVLVLLRPTFSEKDETKRKAMRQELVANDGKLTQFMKKLDTLLEKNATQFFAGKTLTIADLQWVCTLGWFKSGILDGIPANYVDQFATIKKICEHVHAIPKVAEYFKKA